MFDLSQSFPPGATEEQILEDRHRILERAQRRQDAGATEQKVMLRCTRHFGRFAFDKVVDGDPLRLPRLHPIVSRSPVLALGVWLAWRNTAITLVWLAKNLK